VKMHLDELEIDSSYYAFRWWTTLLSREFLLPDTIRLWDSMFASTHKDNFTRYICVTMVLLVRDNLLKGDFAACIGLLQNYPLAHMDTLIEASKALWVYETQVTLACHKGGLTRTTALHMIKPPEGIILAFGFKEGICPKSAVEKLEEAGEIAQSAVRDAKSAVQSYFESATQNFSKLISPREGGMAQLPEEQGAGFNEEELQAFDDSRYFNEFV